MLKRAKSAVRRVRAVLAALARETRGNALIIMTAALIPLAGMVGGGVDISRMYILKTRLQHACDAGALAGRKAMGAGTWAFNNNYARTQAISFFEANIESDAFGSSGMTKTFTENAGRVTGTAQATIPMTLMRIFGRTTETLSVTCASEMRLPNTDVMFVLDTTGSMAEQQPGDSVSKMEALKVAVKCFYEIVARLDTDANCSTGAPSGGTGSQVQIRFGFMPYSTNVNVGRLLPTNFFANSWDYQTREVMWNTTSSNSWVVISTAVQEVKNISQSGVPQIQCTDASAEAAGYNTQTPYTNTNSTNRWQDKTVTRVTSWSNNTCYGTQTRTRYYEQYKSQSTQTFSKWRYKKLPVNVGLLKDGTTWRNSFEWPIGANGANRTIDWDGCIEERATDQTKPTNFVPIPAAAKDLNIDLLPNQGDATTLWGPALPKLIYARRVTTDWNQMNMADSEVTTEYYNNVPYYCPTEARKLQEWPVADAFDNYVDSLVPTGNTYHDIGLVWGARFASPSGIFGSENEYTSKGGEIERHIIFMTDGDACTNNTDYAAYGLPWFDRRQTNAASVPTGGCTANSYTLTEQVNKRTEGLCAAIKNHTHRNSQSFTLWVIAFGNLASSTETRLSNCATTGRYFKATNAAQLQSTFKSIADQISMLRLTR